VPRTRRVPHGVGRLEARRDRRPCFAAEEHPAAKQGQRRVKELERELRRKDKALAETAALLVLSKKLQAIFHQGEDA